MPKAYIIAVKKFPLSIEAANRALKSCYDNDIDAEIFYGIDGLNGHSFIEERNIVPNLIVNKPWSAGRLGCFASHYLLWEKCISLNEPIIILEHDISILRPWPVDLDWQDVLQMDAFKSAEVQIEPAGVSEYTFKLPRLSERLGYNWYSMDGAHAYAIKPHAAQKLIEATHKDGMLAADDMISKAYVILEKIIPIIAKLDTLYNTSLTNNKISRAHWNNIGNKNAKD